MLQQRITGVLKPFRMIIRAALERRTRINTHSQVAITRGHRPRRSLQGTHGPPFHTSILPHRPIFLDLHISLLIGRFLPAATQYHHLRTLISIINDQARYLPV